MTSGARGDHRGVDRPVLSGHGRRPDRLQPGAGPPLDLRVSAALPEPTARAKVVRRRQLSLAAVACTAAVAGALVGSLADDEQQPPRDGASAPVVCPPAVAADPRRLTGQMLVVRMEGSATGDLRRRARRGEIGGVVLFPTARHRDVGAAGASRGPAQGRRRRWRAGAAGQRHRPGGRRGEAAARCAARAHATQARGRPAQRRPAPKASRRAARWPGSGSTSTSPRSSTCRSADAFIGSRAFAADPETVSAVGIAFGHGLQRAGVAATAKHFPGLGRAVTNTDLAPSTVGATRAELRTDLAPFRAAAAAGLELVMASNAVYPGVRPVLFGVALPDPIQALLRDRLGHRGVVISDDLGAGRVDGQGTVRGLARVRAARCG